MFDRYRHAAHLVMFLMVLLSGCPSVVAFTLNFAPLDPPASDTVAFAPSTSMPVVPQFFRFTIVRQQAIIAMEAPYVRVIEPVSPIHFNINKITRAKPEPISYTPAPHPHRHLRGPETFLLRRTQTAADQ